MLFGPIFKSKEEKEQEQKANAAMRKPELLQHVKSPPDSEMCRRWNELRTWLHSHRLNGAIDPYCQLGYERVLVEMNKLEKDYYNNSLIEAGY
jgi:hypothetical protein